jgi:hypothetical protein
MNSNVLYYPFIRVPQTQWFTRVLLYWDTVGSIVPFEYTRNPELLGPHMQSLLTEGLVRQVIPREHLYRVRNFAEPFIRLAESHRRRLRLARIGLRNRRTYRIHIEKLDNIGEQLCRMGLARRADYPWYDIEHSLAAQFMAYLAGVLSKVPDFNSQPITDQQSQVKLYESPDTVRSILLERLFPAPSQNISAADLARFKSRHGDLLRRFRNRVQSFIVQVGSIPNRRSRKQMVDSFLQEAEDEIETILDAMRSQGWRRITLGRFLSYTAGGVALADAITTGGLLSTIAAALGLGGASYNTLQEQGIPNAFQGSFVAYAAIARRL